MPQDLPLTLETPADPDRPNARWIPGPGPFTNLDHAPAQGTHPVPHWRPGETIRDRFTIPIPTNFPPGTYTLLTGFWRPAGNLRLPITPPSAADGEARLRVLTFTVD